MLPSLRASLAITRFDRPIGSLLLLWPTLWALWLANQGWPSVSNLLIFTLGVWVMRSAGCVANDLADRNVDGHVQRTHNRPLIIGLLSVNEARNLLILLLLVALVLVLMLGWQLLLWSLPALLLALVYPLMKRVTHLPQLVLGAAFSWAIPMAFVAELGHMPTEAWLIFIANLLWTVAYDTQYAMVDRDDDLKIGVRSTAILFGNADRLIVLLLQAGMLLSLALYAWQMGISVLFYLGLATTGLHFLWQYWLTASRSQASCFRAFLSNNYSGMMVFVSLLAALWLMAL